MCWVVFRRHLIADLKEASSFDKNTGHGTGGKHTYADVWLKYEAKFNLHLKSGASHSAAHEWRDCMAQANTSNPDMATCPWNVWKRKEEQKQTVVKKVSLSAKVCLILIQFSSKLKDSGHQCLSMSLSGLSGPMSKHPLLRAPNCSLNLLFSSHCGAKTSCPGASRGRSYPFYQMPVAFLWPSSCFSPPSLFSKAGPKALRLLGQGILRNEF